MTKQLYVCNLDDLTAGTPRCFRVENQDVLVVLYEGQVYALQNRCGHMSAALHQGDFTDGLIVCGLHGAGFRVETGEVEWEAIIPPPISNYRHSDNPRIRKFGDLIEGVETYPLQTYPVEIRENEVYLVMPD